jgi:hypothetical protein
MTRPHDTTDLLLAPVALAIDARLQELAVLNASSLQQRITWETNMVSWSSEEAGRAVVADVTYLIPTHGWDVSWDARGIRLQHGEHSVVLGAPDNVRDYVASAHRSVTAGA